jgi:hypothetical protein
LGSLDGRQVSYLWIVGQRVNGQLGKSFRVKNKLEKVISALAVPLSCVMKDLFPSIFAGIVEYQKRLELLFVSVSSGN